MMCVWAPWLAATNPLFWHLSYPGEMPQATTADGRIDAG